MKKIIALLMAVLMTAGMLAACSGTPAETTSPAAENTKAQAETAAVSAEKEKVALKVWADQGELELTEKLCSEFAAEHPEKEYTFEYGAVGAVDGKARYLEDPAAAADVFLFADDQLVDLVKADALYEVTRNTDAIIAANTPGSINAATYDGTLYGYPMTSDNGYFLYYDKSVFTEDDLKTLDGILAAANAAGKKVHMDVSNGWYLASFFLGNGCTLTIEDGKQVIDFNNANGLAAAEAIRAFCNDPAFVTGDDSVLAGGIGDAIACGVSGTWVASAIQEKLGDNYGCCKLPTFTCDGKQVQMGSFLGCKIYGVNSQTAYPVDAMELAEYLTGEKAQIERYNGYCEAGADAEFGRAAEVLFPVKDGPFYACTFDPVLGETMVTMGGIITDGDMNALDANYEPIPGLYMAGNDCGRRFGTEYITPIPGVSLAFALVLGRECGKSVAKFLG